LLKQHQHNKQLMDEHQEYCLTTAKAKLFLIH
jgi:hypothetical protein